MRPQLKKIEQGFPRDNAGHMLAYLLPGHDSNNDSKRNLLKKAAAIAVPEIYKKAYNEWQRYVGDARWASAKAKLTHRLFLGLGESTVLETHVTLHRVYGVPYLPGSALKGLTRAYAESLVDGSDGFLSPLQIRWLFGSDNDGSAAGNLDFQDGWWMPGSADTPLHLEVDTPHHPKYYSTRGDTPATDFDDPNPITHLAVQGGFFLSIACERVDRLAADLALAILRQGLLNWGIGGRVNADYGRFGSVVANSPST